MPLKFGEKLKAIVTRVAPAIGTALGGPLGGVAGRMVQEALGVDSDDAALTAIEASPDLLLKLKEADQSFLARMKELGIEEDRLAYDDIKDARAREVAVRDRTPSQLAWLMILGFLFISGAEILALFLLGASVAAIPPEGWLLIGNISGYLANEAKQAGAYYFGSTIGSKSKDETIAAGLRNDNGK